MRHKLMWKLCGSFGAVLLTFILVIGSVFLFLFWQVTCSQHRKELRQQARAIAVNLERHLAQLGPNADCRDLVDWDFLTTMDELTLADTWVVCQDGTLLTHNGYTYESLPAEAAESIRQVLDGSWICTEQFSTLLSIPTLTAGVPVRRIDGAVIGAVLLHAPVNGIDTAFRMGLYCLGISILIALVVAVILSLWLTRLFIRPLDQMRLAALRLAEGDYTAETGVVRLDEVGQLAKAIDGLAKRLDDASRESARLELMRQNFIATVSHELRTPITVLRGSLEALRDQVVTDPDRVGQYYSEMLSESLYLERLVRDLLELSRLQNPDFKIDCTAVNLCDIVSDVTRAMRRVAAQKEIELAVQSPFSQYPLLGDYGRLRQMLMAVIDNAIKFSPTGQTVEIRLAEELGGIALSVTDFGSGIPPGELPYIFDRFHKVESKGNHSGTGLGLAIAHQIAKRHGIRIDINSQPGVQTRVTFHIQGRTDPFSEPSG